ATDLAKAGDFVEALRCLTSAKEDINHVKNLSSQAALEIRVARSNLRDAETLDMDVGRAREFLEQAVEALTRHQYAIALELARKSSEVSSEVSKSRIWDTLEKFKDRVEKAASEGLHVGMAERCVSEGIQAFRDGRYQDSLKLAMKCETEMERAELQRDISTRAVEMARKKIADAAAEGIKSERLASLMKRAEDLLVEGKYVDAMTAAIECGDELHAVHENLDGCRIELSAVRERVDRLKNISIDTSECDEILDMAQEYLTTYDFVRSRDAMKRASQRAAALFENSIKEVMEQNRMMISKAKSMGINTKPCEDLLEVANTSFSEKLWDFAYQQAQSCKDGCLALISKKLSGLIDEIQARIEALRKLGASVRSIEDMIAGAKEAGDNGDIATAFRTLMSADQEIETLEDSHKKYMDISIAAESAIESLSRFGLSRREPERLMAMAEIEKEKDYDSAIELAAEALDTARNLMEAYSPDIGGSLTAIGLQADVEGEVTVTLRNNGRALARDVTIHVTGDFQVIDTPGVPTLKPGTEESVRIKVVPKRDGSVPISVKVSGKRQLDGKIQTFEIEDVLNIFPAGPPFRLGRAVEITRCISCQGRIKPGFDIVTCRCGGKLHLSCAKRTGACPICGQKYDF
ncbi:MAG: CARDB domain-containing protein, partial [Thermoplasmata archaeon]